MWFVSETETFQGMFDTIITFTSSKFYVNLWLFIKNTNSVSQALTLILINIPS